MGNWLHGKKTQHSINGHDITPWVKTANWERAPDVHDVTGGGVNNHEYSSGLGDGTATLSGTYDTSTTGPGTVLAPLEGSTVTYIRKVQGTGTGLPQQSVSVLVKKYTESTPVADMATWSIDLQMSGDVTTTTQP